MADSNSQFDGQDLARSEKRMDRRAFAALGVVTGLAYVLPARSQETLAGRQVDCAGYPKNLRFFENILPSGDPYKRGLALFGDMTIKEIFEDDIIVLEAGMQINLASADAEIFPTKDTTRENLIRLKDSMVGALFPHQRTLKYLIREERSNWRPDSTKIGEALNFLEVDMVFLPPQLIPDSAKPEEKALFDNGFIKKFGAFKLRDFFCRPKSHIVTGNEQAKAQASAQIEEAKRIGIFRVYDVPLPFGMHELSSSTKNGYACQNNNCVSKLNSYCEMSGSECNAQSDNY